MKKAINIPFTKKEFLRVNELASKRGIGKATVIRMLLEEGIPEFERMNEKGIFVPFAEPEKLETYIQVYLPENMKEKLQEFSERTKLSVRKISRQILIPKMAEERSVKKP